MEQLIGTVIHFYPHIPAAIIKVTDDFKIGDQVHIKGATTDFQQTVESMEISHQPIQSAKAGDEVGLQVIEKVRKKDKVYKIEE